MLIPIVCLTCGLPLGDVAALFRHMRAERAKAVLAKRGTSADQASIDPGLQIAVDDILSALKIRHLCCRMHLISGMVFSDAYR